MDGPGKSYLRKVQTRVITILFFGILVGYIDRVNIAFAALTMKGDVGLTPVAFGWAASLFFLGYFLFEIPGTIALSKLGGRVWMSFLAACWGVLCLAMAFSTTPEQFFVLRFLLGVAEAGFFPGTILYLTYWAPAEYRARLGGYFMAAVPFAMVVGGPLSGMLLGLDGLGGLAGWKWMFVLEGVPAFVLALLIYTLLADKPSQAKWLTEEEKQWCARADLGEAREHAEFGRGSLGSFSDPRAFILMAVAFGGPSVAVGITFWLPRVLTETGLSVLQTGFVSAIPFAIGTASLWFWGAFSDRHDNPKWTLAGPLLVAAAGLALAVAAPNPAIKFAMLLVASAGMFSYLPTLWSTASRVFKGPAKAIGFGLVSMSGALAGFVAPNLLGLLQDATKANEAGTIALTAIAALTALAALQFNRFGRGQEVLSK